MSTSILCLQINVLTKKAFCLSKTDEVLQAKKSIEEANKLYTMYLLEAEKEGRQAVAIGEENDFIDIFRSLPKEILLEKIRA
jgi:hypothetical protein